MQSSIFARIINGEIPSHKIYEDDKVFAFLDIHPTAPGHVLVVPKVQVDEFQDLEDVDYLALMMAVKKIAHRLKEVLGVKRVGLQVIGVDVPHAHIHLIPFNDVKEFHNRPDVSAQPDHAALAAMAAKLAL
ncbi:MAG TPA: HIT domain-containing protein [Candidatus Saccharimonadales bacterium]|jgi:histidine triad (HIT) family protein|nr:HIT domain-containing protein [Candidatus Saccharimonadales bacterium]